MQKDGILAQLGEHLPYKQRVTGSSPVGPINRIRLCRSGGTGRRTGLKILRGLNFVPVRFRSAALLKSAWNAEETAFQAFLFYANLFVEIFLKQL